jgi:hypothetical protein
MIEPASFQGDVSTFEVGVQCGGDGGEIFEVVGIIPDSTLLKDPKAQCIYEKLERNPYFKGLLDKFQKSTQYNVIFILGNTPEGPNGRPTGTTTPNGNTITILIDKGHLDWQPAIWGATTFFHEAFHANLQQHAIATFGTLKISKWPKNINDMTLEELASYIDRTAAGNGPWGKATHEFMARNTEEMAQGLHLFVRDYFPQTYRQVGNNLDSYRALALMGLQKTNYWKTEVEAKNKVAEFEAAWNNLANIELQDCYK